MADEHLAVIFITYVSTYCTIKAFKFATDLNLSNSLASEPSFMSKLIGLSASLPFFFPLIYLTESFSAVLIARQPRLIKWLKKLDAEIFHSRPLRITLRNFYSINHLTIYFSPILVLWVFDL